MLECPASLVHRDLQETCFVQINMSPSLRLQNTILVLNGLDDLILNALSWVKKTKSSHHILKLSFFFSFFLFRTDRLSFYYFFVLFRNLDLDAN